MGDPKAHVLGVGAFHAPNCQSPNFPLGFGAPDHTQINVHGLGARYCNFKKYHFRTCPSRPSQLCENCVKCEFRGERRDFGDPFPAAPVLPAPPARPARPPPAPPRRRRRAPPQRDRRLGPQRRPRRVLHRPTSGPTRRGPRFSVSHRAPPRGDLLDRVGENGMFKWGGGGRLGVVWAVDLPTIEGIGGPKMARMVKKSQKGEKQTPVPL